MLGPPVGAVGGGGLISRDFHPAFIFVSSGDSTVLGMNPARPVAVETPAKRRLGVFYKIASICVLTVLLMIPLQMSHGILSERRGYQLAANEEVASAWGRQQLVTGPVLAVPYLHRASAARARNVNALGVQEGPELTAAVAYFLPEDLVVMGDLVPEIRQRGIYDTVVYTAHLKFSGHFQPDFVAAGIEAERIDWSKARICLGLSDLHGMRSMSALTMGGVTELTFEAADGYLGSFLPLNAKLTALSGPAKFAFAFETAIQGSKRFDVVPVGKVTSVSLHSTWKDPSFVGAALPAKREVAADGFRGEWQSTHFGRAFPQAWTSRYSDVPEMVKKLEAGSFGVRFAQPVDSYSMVERAQKYGMLFFVLIFAVFFLFEVTAKLRIHPLQYALVGVALCLFFVAFLALSEFCGVGVSYGAAAAACTVLVALYARSFLQAGWRTLLIAGGLAGTYGYLYFVLKSQDFALVAGTAALFAVLAIVMFCTRRINWYAVDMSDTPASAPRET